MAKSFYIYNGGTLHRKDNTLQFISEDGIKRDIPIEQVSEIFVMAEMNFNTNLIAFLSKNGVVLHFFNYYEFYTGSFYPKEALLSGELLVKQVEHYTDNEKRLLIAKKFIKAASFNIYRNLRYYNERDRDLSLPMREIEYLRKDIDRCQSVNELMGIEGNIRKIYYGTWNTIVKQDIQFDKRVKNPPDNMINSLISYANTLVYSKVLGEVYHTQLNPTISYLHEPGSRRYSLCLDVAEIFKPIIADRMIFSLLNRNQITEKSFTQDLEYLHLTKDASQVIATELENRLHTTVAHKELGRSVSYQYLIRLELYKLVKHLLGEKEYQGFEMWW